MNENLREILVLLVNLVLLPAITYGLKLLKDFVESRIESEQFRKSLELADKAIKASVNETAQIFVEELKAEGRFGAEEANLAAQRALQRSREIIGQTSMDILKNSMGDVNNYLVAKIEEEVRTSK